MTEILVGLSGLAMIFCMLDYFTKIRASHSTPNPATWAINVVTMGFSAGTYVDMVKAKSLIISVPVIVVTLGVLLIFTYTQKTGRWGTPAKEDLWSLIVSVGVGSYWLLGGNNVLSNLALNGVLLVGHYITVRGLNKGLLREHPRPWILAVVGYALAVASVIAAWDGLESVPNLYSPVLDGVLGNGCVLATIIRLRSKKS